MLLVRCQQLHCERARVHEHLREQAPREQPAERAGELTPVSLRARDHRPTRGERPHARGREGGEADRQPVGPGRVHAETCERRACDQTQ